MPIATKRTVLDGAIYCNSLAYMRLHACTAWWLKHLSLRSLLHLQVTAMSHTCCTYAEKPRRRAGEQLQWTTGQTRLDCMTIWSNIFDHIMSASNWAHAHRSISRFLWDSLLLQSFLGRFSSGLFPLNVSECFWVASIHNRSLCDAEIVATQHQRMPSLCTYLCQPLCMRQYAPSDSWGNSFVGLKAFCKTAFTCFQCTSCQKSLCVLQRLWQYSTDKCQSHAHSSVSRCIWGSAIHQTFLGSFVSGSDTPLKHCLHMFSEYTYTMYISSKNILCLAGVVAIQHWQMPSPCT